MNIEWHLKENKPVYLGSSDQGLFTIAVMRSPIVGETGVDMSTVYCAYAPDGGNLGAREDIDGAKQLAEDHFQANRPWNSLNKTEQNERAEQFSRELARFCEENRQGMPPKEVLLVMAFNTGSLFQYLYSSGAVKEEVLRGAVNNAMEKGADHMASALEAIDKETKH